MKRGSEESDDSQPLTVVVTGGSAGIGLAIAKKQLSMGDNVFICGRNKERLEEALLSLAEPSNAARLDGAACDVRDLDSVNQMVSAATARFGGIDVLINNAGIGYVVPFEEMTPKLWHDIIDTNLTGVFNCCYAALPWLKKSNHADIINLGSRAGRYSFAGGTGYNTTKSGLQGFTEALFLDLNKHGISTCLVAPGIVATELTDTDPKEWHLQPSDVAQVVSDVISASHRTSINWVELRPARPR